MNMDINQEEHHDAVGLSKEVFEDLEMFGAENYFNGDMDSDHSPRLVSPLTNPEVSEDRTFVGPKQSSKNSSETPSVRSASSWNSHSLLLQNKSEKKENHNNRSICNSHLQENNNRSNQKRNNKKSFLANLSCRCVCSNWNSVDVVEEKRRTSSLKKIKTQLSFSENLSSEMKLHQQQHEAILEQRKSLEIFGSPLTGKRTISKKLPWKYLRSSKTEEDGSVSDLSSVLSEIESLTEKAKPFLARQKSSEPDSPDCYETSPSKNPSKNGPHQIVKKRVPTVTAGVEDYSVMSECATSPVNNRSSQTTRIPKMGKSNRETGTQRRKSSSGGLLLGCKSHKSVRVSGDSYPSVNRTPSYVPRFPLEANQISIEIQRKGKQ